MSDPLERLKTALAGRYRIERHLGEGGMATVYLAEDLKHRRKVAVKVLRPELAAVLGTERFVQEITTTASLQHPNILPLFDSGDADGFLYYVMPYIEGETLRDKLNRETQLSIDEAVQITTDVAEALQAAHAEGVIHRDIKPENILLHKGRATVADFGIALAVSAAAGGRLTETGLSLGTPHYMSPEQATADRDLTNRSDIYSLGSVLYEMLTGEPPHGGGSAQAVLMKIVTEPPRPVTELRKSVPPNVTAAVAKSLEKLAADRFTSAGKYAEALTDPAFRHGASAAARAAGAGPWNRVSVGFAGTTILLGILAVLGWFRLEPPSRVMRFSFALPEFGPVDIGRTVTISPDGSQFVHVGVSDRSQRALFLRATHELVSRPVSGVGQGALSPFFSPDGQYVAFGTFDGTIVKVAVAGGPPVTVADSAALFGADWGPDNRIYFTSRLTNDLARVPASGGPVERLATPNTARGETGYRWPAVLPNGRGALVTIWHTRADEAEIGVLDFGTGAVRVLTPGTYPHYTTSGHLIYSRLDGTLMAASFDARALELTQSPVPLGERVVVKPDGAAEFTIADDGTMLLQHGSVLMARLVRVFRDGSEEFFDVDPGWYTSPRVAPDGQRIAVIVGVTSVPFLGDLWTYDLHDSTLSRITVDGQNAYPEWSPSGRRLSFSRLREGERDLYSVPADGSGAAEVMFERPFSQWEGIPSTDGRWLAYRESGGGTGRDIRHRSLEAPHVDDAFVTTPYDERSLALSPDGRWLAYVSDESGRNEVYVRPFPDAGARLQISTDGGMAPRWARSGRELFYNSNEELVQARVAVNGDRLQVENRQTLFDVADYFMTPNHSGYDVFPDDRSFLFTKMESAEQREVVVVVNFLEELKAKVGN